MTVKRLAKLVYLSDLGLGNSSPGGRVMISHLRASDSPEVLEISPTKVYQQIGQRLRNRWVKRVKSTRFFEQMLNVEPFLKSYHCPAPLLKEIECARPDALITVAHGESAFVALSASKKLDIPLVTVFHDWWPCVDRRISGFKRFRYMVIEAKFRKLYRESKIAFCVSAGMRKRLGPHADNPLLHPMLDPLEQSDSGSEQERQPCRKLVYTGDMGHQYGRMIRSLISSSDDREKECAFCAFGHVGGWPKAKLDECTNAKIVNLNQPFQQVFNSMCEAKALLVVAGFEDNDRIYSETSFPSKIIYYSMAGRPIIFWGPKYSSVYEFGTAANAGVVIDSDEPNRVWEAFEAIASDDDLFNDLSVRSRNAYDTHFRRDKLQQTFLDGLQRCMRE